jgi:hypothetical protein
MIIFIEMFWVELSMHNPLDAEVVLSDLTLTIDAPEGIDVTIESLSEVGLRPKETRLVCSTPMMDFELSVNLHHSFIWD